MSQALFKLTLISQGTSWAELVEPLLLSSKIFRWDKCNNYSPCHSSIDKYDWFERWMILIWFADLKCCYVYIWIVCTKVSTSDLNLHYLQWSDCVSEHNTCDNQDSIYCIRGDAHHTTYDKSCEYHDSYHSVLLDTSEIGAHNACRFVLPLFLLCGLHTTCLWPKYDFFRWILQIQNNEIFLLWSQGVYQRQIYLRHHMESLQHMITVLHSLEISSMVWVSASWGVPTLSRRWCLFELR